MIKVTCPHCGAVNEVKKYGSTNCIKCSKVFQVLDRSKK